MPAVKCPRDQSTPGYYRPVARLAAKRAAAFLGCHSDNVFVRGMASWQCCVDGDDGGGGGGQFENFVATAWSAGH